MFWKFIHIVQALFVHFMIKYYSIYVYVYMSEIIFHSSIDGHLYSIFWLLYIGMAI